MQNEELNNNGLPVYVYRERVNRYERYNRYMYLTIWCLYGIVRVFLVLAF